MSLKKIFNPGVFLFMLIFIQCSQNPADKALIKEKFLDSLLSEMTIEEKIGQLTAYSSGWTITGPGMSENHMDDIINGRCGNIFNAADAAYKRNLQKVAVEETRLGIPLMFGLDVVHGFKTIFPIPLAEACSWDMELIEKSARLSAIEGAASGINWTFSPMVDLARDPRWGRVAEGSGEDPFLGSMIAKAKVSGYQGNDLNDTLTLAACVKHFAAYGAPLAGRDYSTVDMSDRVLRNVYLPPYLAAIEAGAATVMTAFNEVHGIPSTGSKYLLNDVLRNEWEFEGLVVTDYTSINEMVDHGYAVDEQHAGEIALEAGVDIDLHGAVYNNHMKKSVEEKRISEDLVNKSVKRVLGLKYDLGLFDDPYKYINEKREKEIFFSDELMQHALESANRSIVLLKNEKFNKKKLLPVSHDIKKIAVIGPLADNKKDVLGSWHASGDETKVTTLLQGLEKEFTNATIKYSRGCDITGKDKKGFNEAIRLAKWADIILLALGENYVQSGEAASRSNIDLPGVQNELTQVIVSTRKPVVAIIMAGRPLTIEWLHNNTSAILYAWHLGTRTGDAIAQVLSGKYNPSAKLVISFPRNVGQIPIFYSMKNTGRPFDMNEKYTTKYIDVPNEPLYPFGYGLSYTTFSFSDINLDKTVIDFNDTLNVSVTVENTGNVTGEEIVQLYVRDMVGSVTRPVKELKGFRKISLKPGDIKAVEFKLTANDLRFYGADMKYKAEAGMFKVLIGSNSQEVKEIGFELKH